jgi:hypothetical protein
MIVDYAALAASYMQMTEEEFALVKRQDLTIEGRACYHRERGRRSPGWHYEGPTSEDKFSRLIQIQKKVKRRAFPRCVM